jgi:hypothetical protein
MTKNETKSARLKSLWQKVSSGTASSDEKIDAACLAAELGDTESVPKIVALLDDSDEDVRYFSLQSLVLDLKEKTENMASLCFRLLREDSGEHVRSMAAACLGSIYFNTKDRRVFSQLRGIVADSREPDFVRGGAYRALFSITGKPPSEWPWVGAPRKVFGESDIDWQLVAQMENEIDAASEKNLKSQPGEAD